MAQSQGMEYPCSQLGSALWAVLTASLLPTPLDFRGPGLTETKPHQTANTVQSRQVTAVLPKLFYQQMQSTAPAALPARPSMGTGWHKTLPHPGVLPATGCIGFTGKESNWNMARSQQHYSAHLSERRGKHHHLRRFGDRAGQGS